MHQGEQPRALAKYQSIAPDTHDGWLAGGGATWEDKLANGHDADYNDCIAAGHERGGVRGAVAQRPPRGSKSVRRLLQGRCLRQDAGANGSHGLRLRLAGAPSRRVPHVVFIRFKYKCCRDDSHKTTGPAEDAAHRPEPDLARFNDSLTLVTNYDGQPGTDATTYNAGTPDEYTEHCFHNRTLGAEIHFASIVDFKPEFEHIYTGINNKTGGVLFDEKDPEQSLEPGQVGDEFLPAVRRAALGQARLLRRHVQRAVPRRPPDGRRRAVHRRGRGQLRPVATPDWTTTTHSSNPSFSMLCIVHKTHYIVPSATITAAVVAAVSPPPPSPPPPCRRAPAPQTSR